MHKAIRSQSDDLGDVYSVEIVPDFSKAVDTARQEFKDEADINILLKRFGVFAPQKQLQFGHVDYGLDLQQAFAAIADAKRAWQVMPADVKSEFPTWQSLLNAIESGQIKITPEAEIVTEVLQSAPTGAQST